MQIKIINTNDRSFRTETASLNTNIEYVATGFTAFQWTLIARWAERGNAARIYNPPNLWQIGRGKKVKPVYINTRGIAHTREEKTTTDAENRAASLCAGRSQDVGTRRRREGWFSGGGTSHRNREVDGAPDGDGLLVGSWWCVRERKERHSFVRSSHKLRHPRVKSSLKLRAVDSLMNWVLPPRPLSHSSPSFLIVAATAGLVPSTTRSGDIIHCFYVPLTVRHPQPLPI